MENHGLWRSLLFAPANRHDLLSKFGRTGADSYVVDLEDGTPAEHKHEARMRLPEALAAARSGNLNGRLLVRINPLSDCLGPLDLKAVAACDADGIVVPKVEGPEELERLRRELDKDGSRRVIVVGIESVRGVMAVHACAAAIAQRGALYFGAEDLATEMHVRRTNDGDELLYARQRVLLAAKAAGIAAIDQAVTNVTDVSVFEKDAVRGRDFGYGGKICLTPRQVEAANRCFSPSSEEISHAQRLLQAVALAAAEGRGTISFEGSMVDAPLIKRAEAILAAGRNLA